MTVDSKRGKGVTLAVCTYNAESRIVDCLEALVRQDVSGLPGWEVVVIDNNSLDNTSQVAQNFLKGFDINFRIIKEPRQGLAFARECATKHAQYEILSFIDDDNIVDPDWLRNVWNIFENNPDVGLAGGRGLIQDSTLPWWFSHFQKSYAVGEQSPHEGIIENSAFTLWGAGLSMRTSFMNKLYINGFRNVLKGRDGANLSSGEDTEIVFAFILNNWKQYYSNKLSYEHKIPPTRINEEYLHKVNQGFGRSNFNCEPYLILIQNIPEEKINTFVLNKVNRARIKYLIFTLMSLLFWFSRYRILFSVRKFYCSGYLYEARHTQIEQIKSRVKLLKSEKWLGLKSY